MPKASDHKEAGPPASLHADIRARPNSGSAPSRSTIVGRRLTMLTQKAAFSRSCNLYRAAQRPIFETQRRSEANQVAEVEIQWHANQVVHHRAAGETPVLPAQEINDAGRSPFRVSHCRQHEIIVWARKHTPWLYSREMKSQIECWSNGLRQPACRRASQRSPSGG
jgi:hypothetical protein